MSFCCGNIKQGACKHAAFSYAHRVLRLIASGTAVLGATAREIVRRPDLARVWGVETELALAGFDRRGGQTRLFPICFHGRAIPEWSLS